jgi:hypothetical protein
MRHRRIGMRLVLLTTILVAFATWVYATVPAVGQDWQEYRRDDLGLRIEMPGKPTIDVEEDKSGRGPVKTTTAEVAYADMHFSASHSEYPAGWFKPETMNVWFELVRTSLQEGLGVPVTQENRLTLNGFPAREFVIESDGFNAMFRIVVAGDRTTEVLVTSVKSLNVNPVVERFMRSFALLPIK